MDRTLYLKQGRKMKVLRDGPSLWITQKGKAGVRVPARLIGRVIISGNIKIDSGAITLFTEQGVSVAFTDSQGNLLGIATGMKLTDGILAEKQNYILQDEKFYNQILKWEEAKTAISRVKVISSLVPSIKQEIQNRGLRESQYEKIINSLISNRQDFDSAEKLVEPFYYGLLTQRLTEAGLNVHIGFKHKRNNFALVKDFIDIFKPHITRQAIQFLNSKTYLKDSPAHGLLTKEMQKDITLRFENQLPETKKVIEKLLTGFFRFLREIYL